jgi:hypothetical protein
LLRNIAKEQIADREWRIDNLYWIQNKDGRRGPVQAQLRAAQVLRVAVTPAGRQQKWRSNTMTQSRRKRPDDEIVRRERLDDDLARKWLEKHAPNLKPKPKSKPQPPERWQTRARKQQQERRLLAKPLLKGVT